jgi:large subunit ribosomal protein L3
MISEILGKKLGMTQVYDAQNVLVPVTVVEAGPNFVVQVKTVEFELFEKLDRIVNEFLSR